MNRLYFDPNGEKAFIYHFFDGFRAGAYLGKSFVGSLWQGVKVAAQDFNQGTKELHANAYRGQTSNEAIAEATSYADKMWNSGNIAAAIHTWGDIPTEKGTYFPGWSNPLKSIGHLVMDFFKPGSFDTDILPQLEKRRYGGGK